MNKKMNIRGSIHDNAQIKSFSTLRQFLDFVLKRGDWVGHTLPMAGPLLAPP